MNWRPRSSETIAPMKDMSAAAVNTMTRPWWNGPPISVGKKCRPVSTDTLWAGSRASTPDGLSRCCTGLKPSSAANTVLTGGRWPTLVATDSGTPWAVSPRISAGGRVLASPAIRSEKKMPMDRDMPAFWNVDRMPDALPRWLAGTLLMIAEVLGEANRPEPTPLKKMIVANSQYGKTSGSAIRPMNAQVATSRPAVANGRGPYLSDRVPEIGPAIRNPAVRGSM